MGHVAGGFPRHVKVTAAFFHSHGFRHSDLYVIDITPVPDGFKNSIAEKEYKNVMDGFFAQVMVYAENMPVSEHLAHLAVQCFGRSQIIAERLFKDHATAIALLFARQFRPAQMIDDVAEKSRTGGEIEEVIAMRVAVLEIGRAHV